jgi:hypothetical protein
VNTSLKSTGLTDGSIMSDRSKRARKLKLGLSGFQLTMRDGQDVFRMLITTSSNSNEMISDIHAKKRERLLCRNRMNRIPVASISKKDANTCGRLFYW